MIKVTPRTYNKLHALQTIKFKDFGWDKDKAYKAIVLDEYDDYYVVDVYVKAGKYKRALLKNDIFIGDIVIAE